MKRRNGENNKYVCVIEAILWSIDSELRRCYWNKYQKEINSPFLNTGESYSNDVFTVRSYYWGNNDATYKLPNFQYKDLKVYWYKHLGRGTEVVYNKEITIDFIAQMQAECMFAIERDFNEGENDEEDY